jgi:hypothetical protein
MNSKIITTQNAWQHWIVELPWNPKRAEASALVALSKGFWLGIPKHEAINIILKIPAASFLRENRHVLWAAWTKVEFQLTGQEVMDFQLVV